MLLFVPMSNKELSKRVFKLSSKLNVKRPVKVASSAYERTDIYNAIDVLVHPIGSEWSLSPLEALALGKVVMVTEKGALSEYIVRTPLSYMIWAKSDYLLHGDRFILRDNMNETHHRLQHYRMHRQSLSTAMNETGKRLVCDNSQWGAMALNIKTEIYRARGFLRNQNRWRANDSMPSLLFKGRNRR